MSNITNAKESIAPEEKRKAVLSLENLDIRDYFAGKALQGYIAYMGCGPDKVDPIGKDESEPNKTVIARCAYKFADAMLAERER